MHTLFRMGSVGSYRCHGHCYNLSVLNIALTKAFCVGEWGKAGEDKEEHLRGFRQRGEQRGLQRQHDQVSIRGTPHRRVFLWGLCTFSIDGHVC
jgi:hypothetical protein